MKRKIFTICFAVVFFASFTARAQTTYNVAPSEALNEYIAANYDENGLSTYVLERDGYYVLTGSINFSGDIAIVAADGDGTRPVIIMGTNTEGASNGWGMLWTDGGVTFKSLVLKVTNNLGARGPWSSCLFNSSGSNVTYEIDDCIIEYSDGVSIWNEAGTGITLILTNSLLRWNGTNDGGKWQGFGVLLKNGSLDWAIVENNTFVENYSSLFMHENGHVKNIFINHNTIISNGQSPLQYKYADRAICMNNLFVDGYFGGERPASVAAADNDLLPVGLYSLDYYRAGDTIKPTGYPAEEDRINLVAYNANYVTPEVKAYWNSMPDTFLMADYEKGDNGFLNDRALKMFKSEDDFNYPYFLWDDGLSIFTEDPGLNGFTVKTAEEIEISKHMNGYDAVLSTENGAWGRFPEAEGTAAYPLAKDYFEFDYSNETYKLSAYGGYPLGDLNWWPDEKSAWENDTEREDYDELIASILDGTFEFRNYTGSSGKLNDRPNGLEVYPNPVAHDYLYVRGAENQLKTIYNITGLSVLQTTEDRIDVSELKGGLYILVSGDRSRKIIIGD